MAEDVLVFTRLDAIDVRATVEGVRSLGVRVHSLALGGMDLTSPAGRMTMAVIAAVAEFEGDLLIERTHAGLARGKAQEKVIGRPSALPAEQQQEVRARRQTVMRVRATLAKERLTDARLQSWTVV